jgi:signal transduction histidine kinase
VILSLAQGGEAVAKTQPDRSALGLSHTADTARAALGELRTLLGVLWREDESGPLQPSVADLDELVDRVSTAGLRTVYTSVDSLQALAPGMQLSTYRIVLEALTSALKYAAGSTVRVAIELHASELRVLVQNARSAGEVGH